jgi:D-threo-aldose 1-dehydrogenase
VGGSPIGGAPAAFGYEVPTERAHATVRATFESDINFLDTSNNYGDGESERRIGKVLADRGGLPGGFVLATKADRDSVTGDFSGERVRRSAEESLGRLGLERFQLYYLHDPEYVSFAEATAPGGAVEAMVALREEGIAEHIGVAGGPVSLLLDFLDLDVFEVVLTHNRFTLVDRSAEPLLEAAAARGVGVVNAAVHGGGILARGASYTDRYAYRTASPEVLRRIAAMEEICERRGVPLRTVALQFSLREPRFCSTVVGVSSPEHVHDLVEMAAAELPDDLFEELAPLAAPREQWLG